jgi:ribose transport system permease protein
LALRFNEGRPLPVPDSEKVFLALGNARLLGVVPVPAVIMLGAFALTAVLLHRTAFGQHLYAIGGNEQAARATGVPVARIKLQAYLVSALTAAIAGIWLYHWLYRYFAGKKWNICIVKVLGVIFSTIW